MILRSGLAHTLLLCGLLPVGGCLVACNRTSHPAQVGERAPNVVIHNGDQTVSLRQYEKQNKVVVLNFWASWCAPCLEEFPSLMQLQKDMPNIAVVAVAFDTDEASYRQYLTDNHITGITTIVDLTNGSSNAFDTTRPPETYIIDRRGIIRRKFIGMPAVEGAWTNPEILNYLKNL